MDEKIIRLAAFGYTANFVAGAVTAIRAGYKAEALGIRNRLPITADALVGYGTALSAPSVMIVFLWRLLSQSGDTRSGRKARGRLAMLASAFLAGAIAEPLSHRLFRRGLPNGARAIAFLNVALPGAILIGALRSLVADEARVST